MRYALLNAHFNLKNFFVNGLITASLNNFLLNWTIFEKFRPISRSPVTTKAAFDKIYRNRLEKGRVMIYLLFSFNDKLFEKYMN